VTEPVQLAARLHAQCEIHAWVDGPNRAWLADIIDEGVETGIMRPHPDMDDIEKTGWQAVTTLLRRTDSEPVVTSYSVCEQFPNSYASTYLPPWPEGVTEEWDALTEKQQRERETLSDAWYDLPGGEQWRMGMEWLRVQRGGLELEPEGFYDFGFGNGFSWLDLIGRGGGLPRQGGGSRVSGARRGADLTDRARRNPAPTVTARGSLAFTVPGAPRAGPAPPASPPRCRRRPPPPAGPARPPAPGDVGSRVWNPSASTVSVTPRACARSGRTAADGDCVPRSHPLTEDSPTWMAAARSVCRMPRRSLASRMTAAEVAGRRWGVDGGGHRHVRSVPREAAVRVRVAGGSAVR
jgi:hypothetical protein